MYEFSYHKADSIEDAIATLNKADDGMLLAGGMTLLPTMKQRLAAPDMLIDLGGLKALSGIEQHGDNIVVGAMTSHATVASSTLVKDKLPALGELASVIGDPQVRNRGTIGGSLANADPAADYPAAVLGLGATINTDKRSIAADDFFIDLFETALDEHEIITSVSFPVVASAGYKKFPNPASGYPIVGVFVARYDNAVRVAVTGAGGCAFRVESMEQALGNNFSVAAVEKLLIDADDLNEDIHASAEYRAHLVTVMASRAVQAML